MSTALKLVAYARVCFRIFFRNAFASATREVSRGVRLEHVDRDLTSPDRDCVFAFEDDPAAPGVSLGDFPVSDVAVPASLLPPPPGSPLAERERFRKEARSTLQPLFAPSAVPGTVRTHETTLRAIAPKVTAKFSSCVLPTASERAFYACLQQRCFLGPSPRRPPQGSPLYVGAV